MRSILSIVVFAAGISMSYAQDLKESQVPAAVKEAFKKQFPDLASPEWEKEGAYYEAEFQVRRVNMENGKAVKGSIEKSVLFNEAGTLLQTEVEIKVSELPAAVSDYVAKNLGGIKIKEAARITEANGTISYEAEVGKDDYIFDANGNFLKKEVEVDGSD